MNKYYKNAVVIPSGLVIAGYVLWAIIYTVFDLGKEYKSEWMTAYDAVFLAIFMVITNSLLICILAASIFLNSYTQIKDSIVLNLLSWFLLPSVYIGYLLTKHIQYLAHTNTGLDSESFFVLSNTIPYLAGLLLTYRKFRLNVTKLTTG